MRWDLKNADSGEVERLAAELSSQPALQLKDPRIASTLARLLVMRGITEAEAGKRFLTPELAPLHSPYLMAGMKTAVDRIAGAIENKEALLIYGDDDVIEQAAAAGIRLIVSVDMGIRAFAPAETARRLGVDLIVTDHHLPGPQGIPAALAVVNP